MLKTGLGSLLLCLILQIASVEALAENLVVYGDESYAPVIYLEGGKPAGILPAIFSLLSKDTGDTYELVLVPWKRAVVESERQSGGITNISVNKAREAFYDFSLPIYDDYIQMVVIKGKEFAYSGLWSLKPKLVGVTSGASYGEDIDKAIADGLINVDRDPGQVNRMKKLLLGRIDVALVGNGSVGFEQLIASDPELKANRSRFVVLQPPLVRDQLHLAFAKTMNKKAAIARFDKALTALRKSPEYQKLLERM